MSSTRKDYTLEANTKVIEWMISEGDMPTGAEKFKLAPVTVRCWWNSREGEFKSGDSVLSRRSSTGARKPGVSLEYVDEIVEAKLYVRYAKEQVNMQSVRDIALDISQRETTGDFNASDGWMSNSWKFRRVTNLIALSDDKLMQRTLEFTKFLKTQMLQSQLKKQS